jgi:hypothetical protein
MLPVCTNGGKKKKVSTMDLLGNQANDISAAAQAIRVHCSSSTEVSMESHVAAIIGDRSTTWRDKSVRASCEKWSASFVRAEQ